MTVTAHDVLDAATRELSHLGLVYLLGTLAAAIDSHPREVFLRGDLVDMLADAAADALIRDRHPTPGEW